MLEPDIKNQLRGYLERLREPIELIASLDDSVKSTEMGALLKDITECSPMVTLRDDPTHVLKPSFGVARPGALPRIRFAGLPMGHEFTSLVLALLQVGGHPPRVEASVIEQIRSLPEPMHFEVFISLTCHNCPDVVQALNTMAALNPNVSCTMIDGALFQEDVKAREIMAVPTVFANGRPFGAGRMPLEEILAKVDAGAGKREVANLANKAPYDVLVVGGGPAGAAAAIYAARKGIRTGLVAERFGGQVLDTLSIENFISVPETQGPRLVTALEEHVKAYHVDLIKLQRAAKLTPREVSQSGFTEVELESGAVLKAKTVVLSTGARWRELDVPGEAQYKTKGVCFCPHCDGPLFKGKRVAVIGGGNSGVEAAIDLAGIVSHVTLIEYGSTLRADEVLQAQLRALPNVTIHTRAKTLEVTGDGTKVTGLRIEAMASGEVQQLPVEGVFVQIGLLPNTDWLKGAVGLSAHGEVIVDARGQTSATGVFAAGDCTTTPFKQIIIAMGSGATAALSAFDHLIRNFSKI